ncbi:hypothetical protein [Actinoplanes aureus]|uniref:Uncharacterized protein n=1 Tax=Actinoplanes aureus TaxID=2792083 RepID=A0A931CD76_9ACTN|nr:hypothetical protein [Actinoplanes aureus]MBG0566494.1 hypothetical protein [Actinoplanes aureus]
MIADNTPAPSPHQPHQPHETVKGALQTPDGHWRVEVVRRGRSDFFRLINGDNVIDGLAITTLQRLLAEAGVDMADLVPADDMGPNQHAGAA